MHHQPSFPTAGARRGAGVVCSRAGPRHARPRLLQYHRGAHARSPLASRSVHQRAGSRSGLHAARGPKIAYLIASVETLQHAQFVRNGTAYDAKAAANHLRLKLRMAGSRVATADDFIRLCASASSVSGLPYQIRFADGRVVSSEVYLRQKLAEFEP